MKRYLLDSGPAQAFVQHLAPTYQRAQQALRAGAKLGLSLPVPGELRAGFELSASRDRCFRQLHVALRHLLLWPFDEPAAEEYGRIYATLHRTGQIIQQVDMQTAAVAFSLGSCTVVTTDSDFQAIPGLSIEDWSK